LAHQPPPKQRPEKWLRNEFKAAVQTVFQMEDVTSQTNPNERSCNDGIDGFFPGELSVTEISSKMFWILMASGCSEGL